MCHPLLVATSSERNGPVPGARANEVGWPKWLTTYIVTENDQFLDLEQVDYRTRAASAILSQIETCRLGCGTEIYVLFHKTDQPWIQCQLALCWHLYEQLHSGIYVLSSHVGVHSQLEACRRQFRYEPAEEELWNGPWFGEISLQEFKDRKGGLT